MSKVRVHYVKTPKISGLRAISVKGKYHNPDEVIEYSFMGGDLNNHQHTRQAIEAFVEKVPGIKLKEVPYGGDIRISFDPNQGAWSYIGTDCYLIPGEQATMNLGWSEPTFRVAHHELCHMAAMTHEHFHGLDFDVDRVYAYFAQIGWSMQDVDNNLFDFDPHQHDFDSDEIDLDSIMLYALPDELFKSGKAPSGTNHHLSERDIAYLNKLFPVAQPEVVEPESPVIEGDSDETPKECPVINAYRSIFSTKKELAKLKEKQLVTMGNLLGLEVSVKDKKSDTVGKVFDKLTS